MVCSTCLQVLPSPIKWLVDHNPAKLFSHQFGVNGILKNAHGTWIENKDMLRLNRPNYDASYQITALTERQAAEQQYLYQQAARLVELCEKTVHTMCGIVTWNEGCLPYDPTMPIQAEAPRVYLEPYMMNCTYGPDTEVSREQKRAIAELFVPRYKKYETAYMTKK
jgi:YD repeat-containing protein